MPPSSISPARECTIEVSNASSAPSSGNIPGSRAASIGTNVRGGLAQAGALTSPLIFHDGPPLLMRYVLVVLDGETPLERDELWRTLARQDGLMLDLHVSVPRPSLGRDPASDAGPNPLAEPVLASFALYGSG